MAFLWLLLFLGGQALTLGHHHENTQASLEHGNCLVCVQGYGSLESPPSFSSISLVGMANTQVSVLPLWVLAKAKPITPLFSRPPPNMVVL
ncbi:MAG: hypothetical protein KDK66_07605 [Deltaproteobacteria bacterium]|nr:hypothetical protein [Deltaproteobacteria bacterium]